MSIAKRILYLLPSFIIGHSINAHSADGAKTLLQSDMQHALQAFRFGSPLSRVQVACDLERCSVQEFIINFADANDQKLAAQCFDAINSIKSQHLRAMIRDMIFGTSFSEKIPAVLLFYYACLFVKPVDVAKFVRASAKDDKVTLNTLKDAKSYLTKLVRQTNPSAVSERLKQVNESLGWFTSQDISEVKLSDIVGSISDIPAIAGIFHLARQDAQLQLGDDVEQSSIPQAQPQSGTAVKVSNLASSKAMRNVVAKVLAMPSVGSPTKLGASPMPIDKQIVSSLQVAKRVSKLDANLAFQLFTDLGSHKADDLSSAVVGRVFFEQFQSLPSSKQGDFAGTLLKATEDSVASISAKYCFLTDSPQATLRATVKSISNWIGRTLEERSSTLKRQQLEINLYTTMLDSLVTEKTGFFALIDYTAALCLLDTTTLAGRRTFNRAIGAVAPMLAMLKAGDWAFDVGNGIGFKTVTQGIYESDFINGLEKAAKMMMACYTGNERYQAALTWMQDPKVQNMGLSRSIVQFTNKTKGVEVTNQTSDENLAAFCQAIETQMNQSALQ